MNPSYVGDGNCEGAYNEEKYSIEDCGWDGGDCIEFNEKYPGCRVDYPSSIGNGFGAM